MKLKQKNDQYREQLKKLSNQLDTIISQRKVRKTTTSPNNQAQIAEKKISILESEIKSLRLKFPKNNITDRLTLEETVKTLKQDLKSAHATNKNLQRKIEEPDYKKLNSEDCDKMVSELRTIKEKQKKAEKKYSHEKKIHEQNLVEIKNFESQIKNLESQDIFHNDNKSLLKTENTAQNLFESDIKSLLIVVNDLEKQKKNNENFFKQEFEKLHEEYERAKKNIESLREELRSKTHENKMQEFEINNLKRKIRTASTKRFALTPDFDNEQVDLSNDQQLKFSKLANVKSESKLPFVMKKPLRSESLYPIHKKIKELKGDHQESQKT